MTTTTPAPVNPLPAVTEFMNRYVAFPSQDQAIICGLWVIHTWTFSESMPNPRTTPYIYIHSPEKQSGKTRLIEVLEVLVRNPMRATDMSPSVLFRSIAAMAPTIMLDEVDAIWSGSKNEEMRGTLNGGYKVGGKVWRIENKEPAEFPTFCPKLLAGIDNGLLPDTIRDRSIPITLQRKAKDVTLAPFFSFDIEEEVEALVTSISNWVRYHGLKLTRSRPAEITTISDRAWEISMPLIAIAAMMDAKTEKRAREALAALLTPAAATLSPSAQLLADIRDAFTEAGTDRLHSADICVYLGDGWNGKLLGVKLAPYGIRPGSVRIGNRTNKGFYLRDFQPIWDRYL